MMDKSYLFLIILVVLLIIYLLYTRCIKTTPDNFKYDAVKTLTRQAARWSMAAKQDQNPLIAILHANYGTGYLWAINDIVTSEQFNSITGLDYIKFRNEITKVQDAATRKMAATCPKFAPDQSYLTYVSGE